MSGDDSDSRDRLDADRWRWLVRNVTVGFDQAPSWNAVVRIPVYDSEDATLEALVDRARNGSGDLEERASEKKYGCYCDLDPGMQPDDCVLDHGEVNGCVYAQALVNAGKGKEDCHEWKPVVLFVSGQWK